MNRSVYIRPLRVEDAAISYQWRNNPKIWRLTGNRPNAYVTIEMETRWIQDVLNRANERRFAICCSDTNDYIGNVFLTDMTSESGQIHIFIGDVKYWGGGRAYTAVMMLLETAFNDMGLNQIITTINKKNMASMALAKACGFKMVREYFDEKFQVDMFAYVYTKAMFEEVMNRQETNA